MLLLEPLDLDATRQDDLGRVGPKPRAQLGEVRGRARETVMTYLLE